jgi:hypothetical protein
LHYECKVCILRASDKKMAPRVVVHPGTRPTERDETVDTTIVREKTPEVPPDELLSAACEAMRLLQDRQAHTPIEMLDPRETRVLRQLRSAVRHIANGKGV